MSFRMRPLLMPGFAGRIRLPQGDSLAWVLAVVTLVAGYFISAYFADKSATPVQVIEAAAVTNNHVTEQIAAVTAQQQRDADRVIAVVTSAQDKLLGENTRIIQRLDALNPNLPVKSTSSLNVPTGNRGPSTPTPFPSSAVRGVPIPWSDGGRPLVAYLTVSAGESRMEARLLDLLRGEFVPAPFSTAAGEPVARIALSIVYEKAAPTANCQWPRRLSVNGQLIQAGQFTRAFPDFSEAACLGGAPTEDAVKEDLAKRVAHRAAVQLMARPAAGL